MSLGAGLTRAGQFEASQSCGERSDLNHCAISTSSTIKVRVFGSNCATSLVRLRAARSRGGAGRFLHPPAAAAPSTVALSDGCAMGTLGDPWTRTSGSTTRRAPRELRGEQLRGSCCVVAARHGDGVFFSRAKMFHTPQIEEKVSFILVGSFELIPSLMINQIMRQTKYVYFCLSTIVY